ncbi:MAG: tRNA (adenosine(37)-N6)-threonylcarbamoyltransferase complex dimerization subunit type 1 TsaB [Candidatus Zixiibacteriota bacterium]
MKILGVDTSTMTAGVGIVEDDEILVDLKFDVRVTYSEILMPTIDLAFRTVGMKIDDLDGLAISIGPGSFTGLRIGLSTVKGLCVSSQKPLASVPSLDALASLSLYSRYQVAPLLDAKKDQVYAAMYDTSDGELRRESKYMAVSVEDLVKKISKRTLFVGPGARLYQKELTHLLGENSCFALNDQSTPSGASVARIGLGKLAGGHTEDIANLEPLYIRMSEAELKFKNVGRT